MAKELIAIFDNDECVFFDGKGKIRLRAYSCGCCPVSHFIYDLDLDNVVSLKGANYCSWTRSVEDKVMQLITMKNGIECRDPEDGYTVVKSVNRRTNFFMTNKNNPFGDTFAEGSGICKVFLDTESKELYIENNGVLWDGC